MAGRQALFYNGVVSRLLRDGKWFDGGGGHPAFRPRHSLYSVMRLGGLN